MNKSTKKKKAFTLVELVIVIAVIGILASVLIPTFADVIRSSKKSANKQQATAVRDEYIVITQDPESTIGSLIKVKDDYFIIGNNLELKEINPDDLNLDEYEEIYDITGVKIYKIKNDNVYKITFNADGGTVDTDYTTMYVKFNTAEFFKDYNLSQTCSKMPIATYNPNGYDTTFEGWKDSNQILVIDNNRNLLKNTKYINESGKYIYEGNVTLIASYTKSIITYNISYVYKDNLGNELPSESITNTNPTTYDVETSFKFKDATMNEYNFKGWYTDINLTKSITELTIGNFGDKTFYGKFEKMPKASYTVRHLKQNESLDNYVLADTDTPEDFVGKEVTATAKTTYEGFTLDTTKSIKGIVLEDGSLVINVYYNRNNYNFTYLVNIFDNNGVITDNYDNYTSEDKFKTYTYGVSKTLPTLTQTGYTFIGWKFDKDSSETLTELSQELTTNINGITLYSYFEANTYSLTYKVNTFDTDGVIVVNIYEDYTSIEDIDKTYTYGVSKTLPTLTQTGYTFIGWKFDTDSSETLTELSQELTTNINGITLYSNFEAITYRITYNGLNEYCYFNNGETNPYTYTIENTFSLHKPNKDGSTFIGWTNSNDDTPQEEVLISKGTTGELEYTANFTDDYITSVDTTNNSVTLTRYIGSKTEVVIPEYIEGNKVILGGWSFADISNITSVTIPDTINSIPNGLLYNCTSLSNVTIPNSITSIGYNAFYGCTSLSNVTIPNSVTSIGYSAFNGCSSLTDVTIPDRVTSIDDWLFQNCVNLKSVTIGNRVTSIGNEAFYGCSNLTDIAIPNSVTSIGSSVFVNCTSLTSIIIPNSVTSSISTGSFVGCTNLKSVTIGNGVTSIDYNAFVNCTNLESVTIGNGVTSIGNSAFKDCSNLMNVTIGNNVTSIGDSVFENCTSLTDITIPNSVTSIGNTAFRNCESLNNVTIGNSVNAIRTAAFNSCTSLKSIFIPSSVTTIEPGAFYNCTSLTDVDFEGKNHWKSGNTSISASDLSNTKTAATYLTSTYTSTWTKDIASMYTTTESNGEITITKYNGLDSIVTIPSTINSKKVTTIDTRAFYDCSYLTSVIIPNSVTSIGENAFMSCTSLTSIIIPNSVTSIGMSAFMSCTSLTSITIPNSVTSIGQQAFMSCTSLTSITIPDSVTSIGVMVFNKCTSLTNIIIPNNVKSIGFMAFTNCENLTSITIPSNVTSIDMSAFYGCTNLTSATFVDPNNWTAGSTSISVSDLSNSQTAATYLTNKYSSVAWTKGN